MLTFWDTVRGVELADTLIRELPKLSRKKTRKVVLVWSKVCSVDNTNLVIQMIEQDGYAFTGSFDVGAEKYVVLEK